YVGEPVAVVFAEDAYQAEDAAELVTVEIEELPVILAADEPPGEFEPGRSTEPTVIRKKYGDLEAAFRAAHAVIELDLSIGRHSGVPMETRGAIARYDATRDVLELHGATKRPHPNRDVLARMLKRAPAAVHLYECHIGGGFGLRGRPAAGTSREMDRGSPRESHGVQPFPPAASPRSRRDRCRRPRARDRR